MLSLFQSAWRYRYFMMSSIRGEFVNRFQRSKLGGLWVIIHPLTQVLIYALILSAVLSAKLPGINNRFAYAIYLCAGMLGWGLFVEIVSRGMTIFIDNGNLIRKIAFPRITLPLIMLGAALVNHLLLLVAILAVFAALGHLPSVAMLWLPLLSLMTTALALGLGLSLGILNVFIRDIGQAVPIVLQMLFWFTPVAYPIAIVPEHLQVWLNLNPLFPLIKGFQNVLVYNRAPDIMPLVLVGGLSLLLLAGALNLFRRAVPDMLDQL